jgi:hypothetical protein
VKTVDAREAPKLLKCGEVGERVLPHCRKSYAIGDIRNDLGEEVQKCQLGAT